MDENYGSIEIRLNELMAEREISKNKLSHKAEMTWKQLDNYCKNNVDRYKRTPQVVVCLTTPVAYKFT